MMGVELVDLRRLFKRLAVPLDSAVTGALSELVKLNSDGESAVPGARLLMGSGGATNWENVSAAGFQSGQPSCQTRESGPDTPFLDPGQQ